MNANGKKDRNERERRLGTALKRVEHRNEVPEEERHVVFDFTGLHRMDVADLSLILTARLQNGPTDNVWVRAIDARTQYILRVLGLDHYFRLYPGNEVMH